MNLEKLKAQISAISTDVQIDVIKAGAVFTLLLRGKNLSNFNIINKIAYICSNEIGKKYPYIEVAKNDDDVFLLVMRQ